jgi:hypothetical protein
MKKILLILTSLVFLISCATDSKSSYAAVGAIHLPEPEVHLRLTFTNDNIEVLGPVDIEKTVALLFSSGDRMEKGKIEESRTGYFLNGQLPLITYVNPSTNWSASVSDEEELVRLLTYEAILEYPEMDYILFPKVTVVRSSERSDALTPNEYLTIRLTGKAVRIKGF